MEFLLAFVVGGLYAAGLYMMLRRSIVKLIIGLALFGHAANLLIFTVAGLTRAQPPILSNPDASTAASLADPLPQALILTAIVIGFGVQAFALLFIHRFDKTVGAYVLYRIKTTDT